MSSAPITRDDCVYAATRTLANFLCSITNPAYFDWYKVRNLGTDYGVVVHLKIGKDKHLYRIATGELVESYADEKAWGSLTRKVDEWVSRVFQGSRGLDEDSGELVLDEIHDDWLERPTAPVRFIDP